jgi:holliday junction DNA helicase RuvA
MIFSLEGKITHKNEHFLVLEVDGIGYQIFTSAKFLNKLKIDQQIKIYTHQHIREDAQELYGFETLEELNFFKELLPISGVGPKTAQNILSLGELKEIRAAIQEGNVAFMRQVKGIGEKTAERIIVDLRGKFEKIFQQHKEPNRQFINTLSKLGYKNFEIREVAKEIPPEIEDIKEQIKLALQILAKK